MADILTHDLVPIGFHHLQCRLCGQSWQRQPRSACPGVKVYPQFQRFTLMTEQELDYAGYRTGHSNLPDPSGCYRRYDATYVMLYDPQNAIKKRFTRRRVTMCVTEVIWPLNCVAFLDIALDLQKTRKTDYHIFMRNLAHMAFQFLCFTSSDMEQNGGGFLSLKFPPVLIHRVYSRFANRRRERETLMNTILKVYAVQRETT